MRAREKERHYWEGFRDALVQGVRNPLHREDSAEVAYQRGFEDGQRAVDRITKKVTA